MGSRLSRLQMALSQKTSNFLRTAMVSFRAHFLMEAPGQVVPSAHFFVSIFEQRQCTSTNGDILILPHQVEIVICRLPGLSHNERVIWEIYCLECISMPGIVESGKMMCMTKTNRYDIGLSLSDVVFLIAKQNQKNPSENP